MFYVSYPFLIYLLTLPRAMIVEWRMHLIAQASVHLISIEMFPVKVPSKLLAAAVAHLRTSLSLPCIFIGLV
jgi:hypothetical protein